MNLLYISIANELFATGGIICRKINRLALKNNTLQFSEYYITLRKSKLFKIYDTLRGYKCGLTKMHINTIIRKINKEKIDIVFIDTSLYGKLSKEINKRTTAKVVTFFHNCEYEIYKQSIKRKIVSIPLLHSVYINEYFSLKYSARCVFLTERDNKDCIKRYGFIPNSFLSPIALENYYIFNKKNIIKKPKELLFVGSYFFPNIHGLVWFINKVLPYVDYRLTIIGRGFEKEEFLKQLNDKSKINIMGYVDSLDKEYEHADIVVQPVFEGSGMKTKTAECLMYGKPLISTSEGLVGYINELKYVYRCDTSEEFINTLAALKNTELPSFCENLRKIFEEYYSLNARTENYKNLIKEIENA